MKLLPMPHTSRKRLSEKEWRDYWRRWERHVACYSNYELTFHRPAIETARKVWQLIEPSTPTSSLLSKLIFKASWLRPEEQDRMRDVAKQSLLVVLDTCVTAGLSRRLITVNTIFDALASRWSDHFRASIATTVWDMKETTVQACRRDLLLNGIQFAELWYFLTSEWSLKTGQNPLFYFQPERFVGRRVVPREKGTREKREQGEKISEKGILDQFIELVSRDQHYRRGTREGFSFLLIGEPISSIRERRLIGAEQPYNCVEVGKDSEDVLTLQSKAVLLFDTQRFQKDYKDACATADMLAAKIHQDYDFDPDRANVKLWIPISADRLFEGTSSQRQTAILTEEGWQRPSWSPREQALFYRAIEEGFVIKWKLEDRQLDKVVRRELKRNRRKWETTHLKNYCRHLNKKPGDGDPPITVKNLIRAWHVSRPWRQALRKLVARYDRVRTHCTVYDRISKQIQGLSSGLPPVFIHSGFYRVINRRYQPTHFWPTFVSARDIRPEDPEAEHLSEEVCQSYRGRWFWVSDTRTGKILPLVGRDISSSQTQILAALLHLDKLLQIFRKRRSFKRILAKRAWEYSREHEKKTGRKFFWGSEDPYRGPADRRLIDLLKALWMRILYGSTTKYIIDDLRKDPDSYGPLLSPANAALLLRECPGFQELSRFVHACRRLAELVYERDKYRGVVFSDPLDGKSVRWNPFLRAPRKIKSEGVAITADLPGSWEETVDPNGKRKRIFRRLKPAATGAYVGDYPVDLGELRRMVAPCLIHMLDAYFSSLVMDRLSALGVTNFVGIHDCWLVPETVWHGETAVKGTEILAQAIREASQRWYQGLERVYDELIDQLQGHAKLQADFEEYRKEWRRRKASGRAFFFAASDI